MPRFLYLLLFFILPSNSFSQKRILLDWDFFKYDKSLNSQSDANLQYRLAYRYRILSRKGNQLRLQFETIVILDTAKSYFNFKMKGNNYKLLNHEQGHADIATIYALKLKDVLNKSIYNKSNHDTQIKQIQDQLLSEMDKKQKEYDLETNHGRDDSVQSKWDLFFKKELHIK